MRDINRIVRMTNKLRMLWHDSPDMRLGQLIDNLAAGTAWSQDIFYLEDDEMEQRIDEVIQKGWER